MRWFALAIGIVLIAVGALWYLAAGGARSTAVESIEQTPDEATAELLARLDEELNRRMTRFMADFDDALDERPYLEVARAQGSGPDEPFESDADSRVRAKVLARFDALRSAFPQFFCEMSPRPGLLEAYKKGVLILAATTIALPTEKDNIHDNPPLGSAMLTNPHRVYESLFVEYLRRSKSARSVQRARELPAAEQADNENQVCQRFPFDPQDGALRWDDRFYSLYPERHVPATESAECLYLILTDDQLGESVEDTLPPWSVKDTDGDGLNEFVDAWGRPIRYLRWPTDYWAYMIDVAHDVAEPFGESVDSEGLFKKGEAYYKTLPLDARWRQLDPTRSLFRNAWFDPGEWRDWGVSNAMLREANSAAWQVIHFRTHQLYDIRPQGRLRMYVVADRRSPRRDMGFGISEQPVLPEEGLDNFPRMYPIDSLLVSAGPDGQFGLYTPDVEDPQGDKPLREEGPRRPMWSATQLDYRCGRVDARYTSAVADNLVSRRLEPPARP